MEVLLGLHHVGLLEACQGIPKCRLHINCDFYRLNVNLRTLVPPYPIENDTSRPYVK
jgi:hypothetical protein